MEISFNKAFKEWSQILSSSNKDKTRLKADYNLTSCISPSQKVPAILYPETRQEIIDCLKIASKYKISVYPVSTGNNWGYGSSLPAQNDSVLINLSRMTRIIDFDTQTGVITLEPGVTQRQLGEYLDSKNLPYLIPVTGAGPDCSLVGNAIERGYGITPYSDHFFSIMSLEAILADGTVYKPCLSIFANQKIDSIHKWGIGPYIDGLFTQSNFGIVDQMSISLAPKPESVSAFFFGIKNPEDLQPTIEKIQKVLRELGGIIGSINLMNQLRVLSMTEPYPVSQLNNGMIPEDVIERLAQRQQTMLWTGVGALYGNKAIVNTAKKEIRKILRPHAKRLVFFSQSRINKINTLVNFIPGLSKTVIPDTIQTLQKTLQLFGGRPSEIALPLAYWISGEKPETGISMKPDQDGCGLIWYSPLIPMDPDKVQKFCTMVKSICIKHKIEPLITLTTLSDRCFDSTIPILFNKKDENATARAHACYLELFETGREHGFVPYRLGIQSMHLLNQYQSIPDISKRIKKALDPDNIIAPKRYS